MVEPDDEGLELTASDRLILSQKSGFGYYVIKDEQ
jgi:hypothetical protein